MLSVGVCVFKVDGLRVERKLTTPVPSRVFQGSGIRVFWRCLAALTNLCIDSGTGCKGCVNVCVFWRCLASLSD